MVQRLGRWFALWPPGDGISPSLVVQDCGDERRLNYQICTFLSMIFLWLRRS